MHWLGGLSPLQMLPQLRLQFGSFPPRLPLPPLLPHGMQAGFGKEGGQGEELLTQPWEGGICESRESWQTLPLPSPHG